MPATAPEPALHAEVLVDATPDEVWSAVTDLKLMAEGSPETVTMLPLKRGGLREGQWYVGINRRKAVVWPTRNVVSTVEPGRTLAWDTKTSGTRWTYRVEPAADGVRLSLTRTVPGRRTVVGKVFAAIALGGKDGHDVDLQHGMRRTLEHIKAAVE